MHGIAEPFPMASGRQCCFQICMSRWISSKDVASSVSTQRKTVDVLRKTIGEFCFSPQHPKELPTIP